MWYKMSWFLLHKQIPYPRAWLPLLSSPTLNWEQEGNWLAVNVVGDLLETQPLKVKSVLTLLKYEPVSVFYVINCDCQFCFVFASWGIMELCFFFALQKLMLAQGLSMAEVAGWIHFRNMERFYDALYLIPDLRTGRTRAAVLCGRWREVGEDFTNSPAPFISTASNYQSEEIHRGEDKPGG